MANYDRDCSNRDHRCVFKRQSGRAPEFGESYSVALAIGSFVASIAAAALLLLLLPEIAQNLDGNLNIWMTSDSIIGRVFGANTQAFATIESLFFGLGVVLMATLIPMAVWVPSFRA